MEPETARSYEAGAKADGLDGCWNAELGLFWVELNHQAVGTLVGHTPSLASVGRERFKGAGLELLFRVLPHLMLSTKYSYKMRAIGIQFSDR